MSLLAWLLVLSLVFVFGLMVLATMTEKKAAIPVWLRSSLVVAGLLFLSAAILFLREMPIEGVPEVASAPAMAMSAVAPHDPWQGVGPPIPAEGRRIYVEAGCHRCHTIGAGTLVGPDLLEGVCKYDEEFLVRWLVDPEAVYTELGMETVNPDYPRMPATGLGPDEALLVARYLESFPQPVS